MDLFARLGKPAQMIIIRDSLLEPAVENYERAQNLVHKEEETEAAERKQKRIGQKQEETRRRRSAPSTMNNVFSVAGFLRNTSNTYPSPRRAMRRKT
jgi:hypothetical protein